MCVRVCLSDGLKSGSLPEANGGRQHIHRERDSNRLLSGKGVCYYLDNQLTPDRREMTIMIII